TLLAVLTPPAIVRHLPVWALTSITSLTTGAAFVTPPAVYNSPRANALDAIRVARMRRFVMNASPFARIEISNRKLGHRSGRNVQQDIDSMTRAITGSCDLHHR